MKLNQLELVLLAAGLMAYEANAWLDVFDETKCRLSMHREKHRVVSRHLVARNRALSTANAVQSLLLVEKSSWDRAGTERLRRTKPLCIF